MVLLNFVERCRTFVAHVTDGDLNNDFMIDQYGMIAVFGLLNFNVINMYTLTVEVWDNRDPQFTVADIWYGPYFVTVTVTINVLGKSF